MVKSFQLTVGFYFQKVKTNGKSSPSQKGMKMVYFYRSFITKNLECFFHFLKMKTCNRTPLSKKEDRIVLLLVNSETIPNVFFIFLKKTF